MSKHFICCFLSVMICYPFFANGQERIWPDKDLYYIQKPILLVKSDEQKRSIHLHANHPELKRYAGKWEWRSENGDTLFTVEIANKKLTYQTKHYLGAKTFDEKRKKHIVRNNILLGVYEYSIRDSVLFSNQEVLSDLNENFFPIDTEEKRNMLIGVANQERRKTEIFLKLYKNPLAPYQGLIKISMKDRKKGIVEWEMFSLEKETLDNMVIRPVTPEEMIFPTRVTLIKTEK